MQVWTSCWCWEQWADGGHSRQKQIQRLVFLSESSWHSLKNRRDKEKGPRTHTHRHDNVPLMNVEYDKEAPYRFALDRDTPNNLTRHRQTNGSPYCLVTHRNEFRNEWIKYRCYLYHDTAKLPIVVIFFFFFYSGFPQYTYYLFFNSL